MFILGATETARAPEVAPIGMEIEIEVPLHDSTVTGLPFNKTTLEPCCAPKFNPVICTWLPTAPVVAETEVIDGPGAAVELIDKLSKTAVASEAVLSLLTATPM